MNIIQFRSISVSFGSMYFFYFKEMLELQKIFLFVRFSNQISCNKGLKAKISCFFLCFSCFTWDWNVLESERLLHSWHHIGWRNTKICIHGASWMNKNVVNVENRYFLKGNCKFFSVIWVKWKQSVCSITLPYSSTFYSLFLPFFVLEIFKFKYDKFFVRHSASISKFEWSEQPCVKD